MSPSECYAFAKRTREKLLKLKDDATEFQVTLHLTNPGADALIQALEYFIHNHHPLLLDKEAEQCPHTQTNHLPNQAVLPFR